MRHPLNPEAGQVPHPEDPTVLAAALAAGPVTYRIFPYYAWRYGERGRRFTRSDSAWLATLIDSPDARIDQQLGWLARVLASRGMPTHLLIVHLEVLRRQLRRAVPERADDIARLAASAARLAAARDRVLPPEVIDALAQGLADHVLDEPTADGQPAGGRTADREIPGGASAGARALVVGAGRLLCWATTDRALGIEPAVDSVRSWLDDIEALTSEPEIRRRAGEVGVPRPDVWAAALDRMVDAAVERSRS